MPMICKLPAVAEHVSTVLAPPLIMQAADIPVSEFLDNVHDLRGLAIFLMVAGHVINCFDWDRSPGIERLLGCLFQGSTVLFVFIAGYLFQHLSGKYRYVAYLASKVRNVALPYLIMSTPAIVWFTCVAQRWIMGGSFYEQPVVFQMVSFYATGEHLGPYWFVPMIMVFYLAAPLFIYLDRHEKSYWLLPAALGVSFCVARGSFLANCVHFFSVYVLGMFCSHYHRSVLSLLQRWRLLLVAIGVALTIIQFERESWSDGIQLLQRLAICGLCLGWFREIEQRKLRWTAALATLSFGIYFVHPYVLFIPKLVAKGLYRETLNNSLEGAMGEGSLPMFIMTVAAVLLTSIALVLSAKWVFGRYSRMIVGC